MVQTIFKLIKNLKLLQEYGFDMASLGEIGQKVLALFKSTENSERLALFVELVTFIAKKSTFTWDDDLAALLASLLSGRTLVAEEDLAKLGITVDDILNIKDFVSL